MAGGNYKDFETPKQLFKVRGETIIERTIRLLKENGVNDIFISTHNPAFDYIDTPKLLHQNDYVYNKDPGKSKGWWLDAFYPSKDPVCYIWGDVYFSNDAIKTIVNTEVDDIELFASKPPFNEFYPKNWVEPFALKVANTKHLKSAIAKTKQYANEGKTWRKDPIIWELWTVIKDMPLQTKAGEYVYNYTAINDYTSDIDDMVDISKIERAIKLMKGEIDMVRCEVIEEFTLGNFKALKDITRRNINQDGRLFVGDRFTCDDEMAKYLTGNNSQKKVVVKVVEVLPKAIVDTKIESEKIIPLDDSNLKEIAKQVNKAVKKSKKSKR